MHLVELAVEVRTPGTHVVRREAVLLLQVGHRLAHLHTRVLPALLRAQQVRTHQRHHLHIRVVHTVTVRTLAQHSRQRQRHLVADERVLLAQLAVLVGQLAGHLLQLRDVRLELLRLLPRDLHAARLALRTALGVCARESGHTSVAGVVCVAGVAGFGLADRRAGV